MLLPQLQPEQVLVLDNATFHKSEKTKELIKQAKCRLVFLPPYSPDLNPIEKQLNTVKLGRYQVTQAQYQAIVGSNPSNFQGANRPVEKVTWDEAVE